MGENGRGWRGLIERRHARRQAADARDLDRRRAREKRTLRGWPAVRLLLTIGLFTLAVLFLVGAGFAHHEATVLRDEGVLATGRVEEVVEPSRGADYANVRFTARDGRTMSVKVTVWKELPAQGDRVTLCYAPRAPDAYVQDARVCPDFAEPRSGIVIGLGVLVALAALWAPWLLRRSFRPRS